MPNLQNGGSVVCFTAINSPGIDYLHLLRLRTSHSTLHVAVMVAENRLQPIRDLDARSGWIREVPVGHVRMPKEPRKLLNFEDSLRGLPRTRADAGNLLGLLNFNSRFLQLLGTTRLELVEGWEVLLEDG